MNRDRELEDSREDKERLTLNDQYTGNERPSLLRRPVSYFVLDARVPRESFDIVHIRDQNAERGGNGECWAEGWGS